MIIVVKLARDRNILFWNGEDWVEGRGNAKQYKVSSSDFTFGNPFPKVERGEELGLIQTDTRMKWRSLGIPSPEETLAVMCYKKELRERICPNVALILQDGHNVRGAVLVKREALKQHPELLERLRQEAQELYNQVVVMEEWPVLVEPQELSGWLRELNPSRDEESPMPWEEAAKWAISGLLDSLEWRTASGSVVVCKNHDGPMGEEHVECTSLDQLLAELEEAGQQAWGGEVPFDGGGEVFEMASVIDVSEMLFERCEEELKEIGWG